MGLGRGLGSGFVNWNLEGGYELLVLGLGLGVWGVGFGALGLGLGGIGGTSVLCEGLDRLPARAIPHLCHPPPTSSPQRESQSVFPISMRCTTSSRIPASASPNQGPGETKIVQPHTEGC